MEIDQRGAIRFLYRLLDIERGQSGQANGQECVGLRRLALEFTLKSSFMPDSGASMRVVLLKSTQLKSNWRAYDQIHRRTWPLEHAHDGARAGPKCAGSGRERPSGGS
jgi:hypothetical protein